jgi:hypothetical protein
MLVAIVLLLWPKSQLKLDSQKLTLAETPVARYDNNSIVFSNERQFIVYNYTSGQTRALSIDQKLPTIRSLVVSADKRFLLFNTTLQSADDPLGAQLISQGLPLDTPYWWLFDTTTQKFQHLGAGSYSAVFSATSSNALYSLYSDDWSNGVDIYNSISPLNKSDSFITKTFSSLSSTKSGLFAESSSGEVSTMDTTTQKIVIVTTGVGGAQFSNSGAYATAIDKTKTDGQSHLLLLNIKNGKRKSLGVINESTPAWSVSDDSFMYKIKGSGLTIYNAKNNKKMALNLKNKSLETTLNPGTIVSENSFVAESSDGVYVLGKQLAAVPAIPKTYNKNLSDGDNLTFSSDQSAFVATINGDLSPASKQAVYNQLRKDGINPDLVTIRFNNVIFGGGSY